MEFLAGVLAGGVVMLPLIWMVGLSAEDRVRLAIHLRDGLGLVFPKC